MEKAIELFAARGIQSTSVQQITEHCGISKGAFYLAFKSKDELILSIIDYFMKQFISDIDQVVNSPQDVQVKLFEFYFTTFKILQERTDFGKMLIKEQSQTLNPDLIRKLNHFNELSNQAILQLLNELYGEDISHTKYDLLICIKGMIESYSRLFFSIDWPINLELLSQSLVEKTNLLAAQSTIAFLNKDLIYPIKHPTAQKITPDMIIIEIDTLIDDVDDPLEQESLIILKDQLTSEEPSRAIVSGLLHNLKNNKRCKWLVFLINHYFIF